MLSLIDAIPGSVLELSVNFIIAVESIKVIEGVSVLTVKEDRIYRSKRSVTYQ